MIDRLTDESASRATSLRHEWEDLFHSVQLFMTVLPVMLLVLAVVATPELLRGSFPALEFGDYRFLVARRRVLILGGVLLAAAATLRVPAVVSLACRRPAFLIAAPIVSGLLATELLLSAFVNLPYAWIVDDPELGWALKPGEYHTDDGTPLRINSRGMRGVDIPVPKPPDVTRLLFLGDSGAFGHLIPDPNAAYPQLTATLLQSQCQSAFDAANTGVPGYAPWQFLHVLEQVGPAVEPHTVILSLNPEDVQPATARDDLLNRARRRLQRPPVVRRLLDRSALRAVVAEMRNQIPLTTKTAEIKLQGGPLSGEQLAFDPDNPAVRVALQDTEAELKSLVEFCRTRGWRPIAFIYPWRAQVQAPEMGLRTSADLAALAERAGMPAYDPLPRLLNIMRSEGQPLDVYYADRHHLTAYASLLVTASFVEFLGEELYPCGQER